MNEYAPIHPISERGRRLPCIWPITILSSAQDFARDTSYADGGCASAQLCGQEASSSDAPAAVGFGAAPSAWVGCWHRGLFAVSRQRATVIVRSYYLASEPCNGHSDDAYDHRQDGGA